MSFGRLRNTFVGADPSVVELGKTNRPELVRDLRHNQLMWNQNVCIHQNSGVQTVFVLILQCCASSLRFYLSGSISIVRALLCVLVCLRKRYAPSSDSSDSHLYQKMCYSMCGAAPSLRILNLNLYEYVCFLRELLDHIFLTVLLAITKAESTFKID